jgi:hypothetical protein
MKVLQEIVKMKFTVANGDLPAFDALLARLESSLDGLGSGRA